MMKKLVYFLLSVLVGFAGMSNANGQTFSVSGGGSDTSGATMRTSDSNAAVNNSVRGPAMNSSLGIGKTSSFTEEVVVYPNPARDAVNVLYDENAGVKRIAIYNLIGKMMQAYIPMDTKSAKLDIDNIPAGVYFIRLMDGQGHVLATRRFTRQ